MITVYVIQHLIGSLLTLYMCAILLRWTAPYLELDVYSPRWRWLVTITDPPFKLLRRYLPPLGHFDAAPPVAVLSVWLVRMVLLRY